jgi:hypothetical protein
MPDGDPCRIDFLAKRNVDFTIGEHTGQMLTNSGLVNVQQRALNFPMGDWGGRIGRASATDCLAVGKALRAGVIAQDIMPADHYDALYARPAGVRAAPGPGHPAVLHRFRSAGVMADGDCGLL